MEAVAETTLQVELTVREARSLGFSSELLTEILGTRHRSHAGPCIGEAARDKLLAALRDAGEPGWE
jgi:hypothetical protein